MTKTLWVAALLVMSCVAITGVSGVAHAQRIDVAVGGGSMFAPPGSQASPSHSPESLNGGLYASISADLMLRKHFGVQAEIAGRGSRAIYFPNGLNQPFRPFLYDLNAMWLSRRIWRGNVELTGGAGAETTRFYKGTEVCGIVAGCVPLGSSTHFLGHFGGGIRFYPTQHGFLSNFFVRPEGHLYLVNNNVEFSSARAVRYGVSVGYTFGAKP